MVNVEQLITEYRNETYRATVSFYAWRRINNLAETDRSLYHSIQRNALSWTIIQHSLQVTFIVTLGRLFDNDSRSFTVQSFITRCQAEIGQFSKSALEARKMAGTRGARPEWLDNYLDEVVEPTERDFDALNSAANEHKKLYRKAFQPIRHKVFAHKNFNTMGNANALFANTTIAQAEEILQFLRQVLGVVTELFNNAKITKLGDHNADLKKLECEVNADVEAMLKKLSASQAEVS